MACVAALWAPVDLFARYQFVLDRLAHGPTDLREEYEALRQGTEQYFGDEATMQTASVTRIVGEGEATHLPRLWVCHPELDANVPLEIVSALEAAWRKAGGEVAVTVYQGQPHAFGHTPGPATDRFVDELAAFVQKAT